ncbi:MAG: DUF502 domain-containing protein [Dehalococcoidia bacterium]|nr:DUF502 domain-containing protein [Dehalococcoidia bacterium]
MKSKRGVSWGWLGRKLRAQFLTGILVVVPIGATILILIWIFDAIDGILRPVIMAIFGQAVPGVGFAVTMVLIYLVGVAAGNVGGRALIRYGETLLAGLPVVRQLYASIKQILESFSAPGKTGLMQVVLVEFPRKGMRTIGFITNESSDESGNKLINIFIPTSPNPTSGFLQIVREEEIIRTNIPVNEAMKMVISAGKVSPQEISEKLAESLTFPSEVDDGDHRFTQ